MRTATNITLLVIAGIAMLLISTERTEPLADKPTVKNICLAAISVSALALSTVLILS